MQSFIKLVKELGFPIAISAVLLYFCFCTLERNTAALVALDKSITILTEIVRKDLTHAPGPYAKDF